MPVEPAHLISGPGFTDRSEFGRPRRMARLRTLLSRRKRATVPECSPDHLTPAGPGNPSGIMIEDNQHRDCLSIRETDSSGVTTDLIHFCDWPALRSAIDQHQRERGGVT